MSKLDMSSMYAFHDALRRELRHIAEVTERPDDDPRQVLATAVGWELFKKALHIHHTAEDDALWPAMRAALAGRPDDLALLDAMEAEHAAVDPAIDAVDAALADRETGPARLGELTDVLATALTAHLKHEEDEALALIDATLTEEQWRHFGQVSGQRVGADVSRIIPWMLDGASERATAAMLAPLPEPVRAAYANEWVPAYRALDLWAARAGA
ncbi:hemerythrin domain-containing protein [Actinomadura opuntiae]|uniref:hemerythrin domain-containing protein n=1 Tax=Actinomadura sp. OS1-43 TaxID=604315 RepID=UPI00255B1FDA|nr:hemerythrin domain-containing protein [Actinomadura sp. OS1-43]MDL4818277.1 hemerythrin domain-containing protein [Actinomadura sp. OS1-43]